MTSLLLSPQEAAAELLRRRGRIPTSETAQAKAPPAWQPLPGPQIAAYHSPADEVFYGGAAGGGKSDLLLGLALTAHQKSLILRRQATQLPELVDRVKSIALIAGGRWSGSGHGGTMRLGGRVVELAGCDHEDDKVKYKGRPHDLKAFDELSDFTESQYLFIGAWARTSDPRQQCRKVSAGNPPTSAVGEWVIRRWAPWLDPGHSDRAVPGELRWYAMVDGKETTRPDGETFVHKGETIQPASRTFIPARLADNPFLLATGYGRTLDALPEPLRSQLLKGDFTAARVDDPWQVIPSEWVRAAMRRWDPEWPRPPARVDCVGVDVARGGADWTVLAPRMGTWFGELERFPGVRTADGPSVAGLVRQVLTRRGFPEDLGAVVHVDVIGVGASVYDSCVGMGLVTGAVNFGSAAWGRDRTRTLEFANLRAWAYWNLRDALDPDKGDGLQLPDDPQLLADLTAPRWEIRTGRIYVEEKAKIIERLGRSPDSGDAVVMAAMPPVVGQGELPVAFAGPRR